MNIGILVDVSNIGIISLTTAQKITRNNISEGLWIYTFLNKLQKLIAKDILLQSAIQLAGYEPTVRKTKKVKQNILSASKNINFDVYFVREYRHFSNINLRKQVDNSYKQSISRISFKQFFKQQQSSTDISTILKSYVRKIPNNSWQLTWTLIEFVEYILPVYSFDVKTNKVIEADDLIGSLFVIPSNYQKILSKYDVIYIISRDRDYLYLTSLPNVYQLDPTTDKTIKLTNQNVPLIYTILKAILGDTADNIKSLSTELNNIFKDTNLTFKLYKKQELERTIADIYSKYNIDFQDFIKFIKGYQFNQQNLVQYLSFLKELSKILLVKHLRPTSKSLNAFAELEAKVLATITEQITKKLKLILPELIELDKDFQLKQPNSIVNLSDYFKELKITRLDANEISKIIRANGNAFDVLKQYKF